MGTDSLSFVVSNAIVARACVKPVCAPQTRRIFRMTLLHGYRGSETVPVPQTLYHFRDRIVYRHSPFPRGALPQNLFVKGPISGPLPPPVVPWSPGSGAGGKREFPQRGASFFDRPGRDVRVLFTKYSHECVEETSGDHLASPASPLPLLSPRSGDM
eukprot:scaffold102_cov340-Pavlova_lutheri.AAC.85